MWYSVSQDSLVADPAPPTAATLNVRQKALSFSAFVTAAADCRSSSLHCQD